MAAKEAGCYKVILDCAEANAAFYEKCGLTRKEVQMVRCSSSISMEVPASRSIFKAPTTVIVLLAR